MHKILAAKRLVQDLQESSLKYRSNSTKANCYSLIPIWLISFLLLYTQTSCTFFNPTHSIQPPSNMPSKFSMYSEGHEFKNNWWQDFNSDELNSLINEALAENFTIKEAWARLQQSRYSAIKAGAENFPDVSYRAAGLYQEKKDNNQANTNSQDWSLGFSLSYEMDLWGRIRADKESASLAALATEEDLKTAIISITGQIAETWISLVSNKKQQELFAEQIDLQNQLLHLIKVRFPLAKSTALDIYQQQQSIEQIEATLIPLTSNEKNIKRQLALLLGKSAIDADKINYDLFPEIPKIPDIGLPADLLAARPDIRAAGLRLKSSQWEITAAKADRLPSLKLTASQTYSSEEFSSLFDNWIRNLAGNLTGPIFDGKKRRMEVERTKSVVDERLATYGKTVFTAIKEVEDALEDELQNNRTLDSLTRQLALSEKTMREAKNRYLNGNSDFINILREQLNILQIQQNIIKSRENALNARINLYKALGGSWVDSYVD